MSTAQRLVNEGIEQGIERGVALGVERSVRGMLKLGMDAAAIAAAFGMPIDRTTRLIEKIKREQA